MDHYARAYPIFGRIKGFYSRRFQDMLYSLRVFDSNEVAKQRMKIIKSEFNRKLADYIIFYNTERPHKSLGLKSPVEYLIENGGMSQKCLTYTFP